MTVYKPSSNHFVFYNYMLHPECVDGSKITRDKPEPPTAAMVNIMVSDRAGMVHYQSFMYYKEESIVHAYWKHIDI